MACGSAGRVSTDALSLAGGTVVTGGLAYAFVAVVTRTVGAEASAPIAVLWTYWSASAAVLVFPLQHWIVRRVAAEGNEDGVRASVPRIAAAVVLLAMCAIAASWILRDLLFGREGLLFPAVTGVITIGSGFVGLVRGWLASRERFIAVAGTIAGENGVRIVAALSVAFTHPASEFYAIALASGPLIGLVWPGAIKSLFITASPVHANRRLGFLGGIAGSSLFAQLVLTSGPVVLALIGGSPSQVTALFAALALYRAPYLIALGMVAQLTGYLTGLVVNGRDRLLRQLRWLIASGSVVVAGVGWLVAYTIGTQLVAFVFGETVSLPRPLHGWLTAGTALALGNLVMTLLLVARRVATKAIIAWALGTTSALAVLAVIPDPLIAVIAAFLTAEFFSLLALVLFDVTASRGGFGMAQERSPFR